MIFPAITRSVQSKLKASADRNDYSGWVRPIRQGWISIPKNFRARYMFTGIFFAVVHFVLLTVMLSGPANL
jgi:hypothetical protein